MSSYLPRVQLVQLEVRRLSTEAQTCTDPERLAAIVAEVEVLRESMLEIRREQLREEIARKQPKRKRRWWFRGAEDLSRRCEELEAGLRRLLAALDEAEFTVDGPVARMSSGMDVHRRVVEAFGDARALLKDGER